jgi:predicted DNA-binding transcriptional regulator
MTWFHTTEENIYEGLTEVSHIMMEAGMILIVSAIELDASDLDVIKTGIPAERISVVWLGNEITTDIPANLVIEDVDDIERAVETIRKSFKGKKRGQGLVTFCFGLFLLW